MNQLQKEVKDHFYVQEESKDVFVSSRSWKFGGPRGLYGGQLVSQALSAAVLTVEPNFVVHSLHSYFLLPGKYEGPVHYHVERLRDGRSFTTRIVRAKQDGNTIFTLDCSFQTEQTYVTEHQYQMPPVYPPDTEFHPIYIHKNGRLPDVINIGANMDVSIFDKVKLRSRVATHKDPSLQKLLSAGLRYGVPNNNGMHKSTISPPYSLRWFKIDATIPLQSKLHILYLALISDFWTPTHVATPYFHGYNSGKINRFMVATIDHSVWFHNTADVTEWFLFEALAPIVSNDRMLIKVRLYSQNGTHIMSAQQENTFRIDTPSDDAITSFNFYLPPLAQESGTQGDFAKSRSKSSGGGIELALDTKTPKL